MAYNGNNSTNVKHVTIELNVEQATDLSALQLSEILQDIART